MWKFLGTVIFSLTLAACQTTSGPTAGGISKLQSAGFLPAGTDGGYACRKARCGADVGVGFINESVPWPGSLAFTLEQLIVSGNLLSAELKKGLMEREAAKASNRLDYSSVSVTRGSAVVIVRGTTKREDGLWHFAGKFRARGNSLSGFIIMSQSAPHLARYLSLVPLE